jgi:hypothetical protein
MLQAAVGRLGLQLHMLNAANPSDFEPAFAKLSDLQVAALMIAQDVLFSAEAEQLGKLAVRYKIPAIYVTRSPAQPVKSLTSICPATGRTPEYVQSMSALPPKSRHWLSCSDVRFVPEPDIGTMTRRKLSQKEKAAQLQKQLLKLLANQPIDDATLIEIDTSVATKDEILAANFLSFSLAMARNRHWACAVAADLS